MGFGDGLDSKVWVSVISDLASMQRRCTCRSYSNGGWRGGVELEALAGISIHVPPVYILNINNFVHITQHATGDAN